MGQREHQSAVANAKVAAAEQARLGAKKPPRAWIKFSALKKGAEVPHGMRLVKFISGMQNNYMVIRPRDKVIMPAACAETYAARGTVLLVPVAPPKAVVKGRKKAAKTKMAQKKAKAKVK